jgi:hypothetical protein
MVSRHVRDEDSLSGRANTADLSTIQREPLKRAIEPGPVATAVEWGPGARGEMQATRLIGTLCAERTGHTAIAWRHEPHTRQRRRRSRDEAVDDLREHTINRALGGNGKRDGLEHFGVHGSGQQRDLAVCTTRSRDNKKMPVPAIRLQTFGNH